MACVLVFLMSVYSWLNFLNMETGEAIRGLSKYDMSDADRKFGYKWFILYGHFR